jgi:hypothetical protein
MVRVQQPKGVNRGTTESRREGVNRKKVKQGRMRRDKMVF